MNVPFPDAVIDSLHRLDVGLDYELAWEDWWLILVAVLPIASWIYRKGTMLSSLILPVREKLANPLV